MARGKKLSRNRLVLDFMLLYLLPLSSCENRQWLGWVESFRILLVFLRQRLVYKSRRFGSWTPVMCWAVRTTLCRALSSMAVQFPYQLVMEPVRTLSTVHV